MLGVGIWKATGQFVDLAGCPDVDSTTAEYVCGILGQLIVKLGEDLGSDVVEGNLGEFDEIGVDARHVFVYEVV